MIKNKFNKMIISGMSLPIAMMFTLGGAGILYSFYSNMFARNYAIDLKAAKYKAKLNAHSGIAHAMANHLYRKDFFTIKLYYLDKFLITFFFLILITGIYNDISININNKIFSEYRGIFYTTFKFEYRFNIFVSLTGGHSRFFIFSRRCMNC